MKCSTKNLVFSGISLLPIFAGDQTAFVMQNFRNLEASGSGVTIFDETPKKAHPSRVLSPYACKSVQGFSSRRANEKRDTTKSHREVIFHLFAGNSPLKQIKLKLASE